MNEELYRMVGAANGAGPGALKGARGWAGTAATFVACVIPPSPYEAEVDPRLWERGLPFPDAFRLPLPWCLRLEPRQRQQRIFSFQVSNIEPSASCVANSRLRRAKTFIKGAGHRRRLCSVDPQLAAVLYRRLTAGVFSTEGCREGQVDVDHVICNGIHNSVVAVIEGPEAVIDREGVPAVMYM